MKKILDKIPWLCTGCGYVVKGKKCPRCEAKRRWG